MTKNTSLSLSSGIIEVLKQNKIPRQGDLCLWWPEEPDVCKRTKRCCSGERHSRESERENIAAVESQQQQQNKDAQETPSMRFHT
ncbi:hypothetical protein DMENIID0001_156430 [Sergentomyia squamirostris]